MKQVKGTFINRILSLFRLYPDYDKRVFGLDLMRALAIIFVVMGHGLMLKNAQTNFPWIKMIDGVELFFVLSGFLIGGIIIKIFQNTENFGIKTLWNFWIRRWFRTLPNYYLILIINIAFVYFGIINEKYSHFNWKFFFFFQNFSEYFTGFFWESWSLSVEEWFYLLFPIVLSISYVLARRIKVPQKQVFLVSLLVFMITPILLRVFIASKFNVNDFWFSVKINKVVIFKLDSISYGLLAAFIKNWYPKFWFKSRNITFILGIILSYTVLYLKWMPNEFVTKVFKFMLQSIGCFLLLPKFDSIKKAPPLIMRIFTHISLISYSMYLINLALVAEVMRDNFLPKTSYGAWASYGLYWIIVIVLSTIIYKYYEKPLMDLRDKWKRK